MEPNEIFSSHQKGLLLKTVFAVRLTAVSFLLQRNQCSNGVHEDIKML